MKQLVRYWTKNIGPLRTNFEKNIGKKDNSKSPKRSPQHGPHKHDRKAP